MHASGGANAASTTMPSGSSTTSRPRTRARGALRTASTHPMSSAMRAHLVERALPRGDDEPGLLLDLAGETGEQRGVGGVDHAARRAPVGDAVAPLVADEQEALGLDSTSAPATVNSASGHALSVARGP